MLLLWRALLVLGLAALLHGANRDRKIRVRLGQGTRLNGKTVRLILNPSLQSQITSMSSPTLANRSLSPWTYSDSRVDSRLPTRISHAQCKTSGCLSLQGEGEDAALEAKPIYYQVLVLHRVPRQRRGKQGGRKAKKDVFRLGTEVIAVGCTCVRPSVVPQQ